MTDWLHQELERAENKVTPDPGRVTARRLNRAEYNNTIRDLLGVDFGPPTISPDDSATASTTSATCSPCRRS